MRYIVRKLHQEKLPTEAIRSATDIQIFIQYAVGIIVKMLNRIKNQRPGYHLHVALDMH
jgi:hypothetical protein